MTDAEKIKLYRQFKRQQRKLDRIVERRVTLNARADAAAKKIDRILHKLIPKTWQGRPGYDPNPILGQWDCEDSPIGVCVYDGNGWNGFDECMFCGEPGERK